MKCLLDGANVKVLARAFHALAKIGEELHFEPTESGLVIKTVNSSKSAFSSFHFRSEFFLTYSWRGQSTAESSDQEDTVAKCKLPMKSILSVFRSIPNLEKSVETCAISLPHSEALLIVELKCKHGIAKMFNLRYYECESVEAEFSKDAFPSKFTCSAHFYTEALQCFHSSIQEVTWSLAADQVHLSNYIDEEMDPAKCVRTDVTLAKEEFFEFNVALSTQVTFCLKELRAILFFAEPLGLDIQCRMEGAGQPVLFSINREGLYSSDFLLATLTPSTDFNSTASSSVRTVSQRDSASNRHPSPIPALRNKTDSRLTSRSVLQNTPVLAIDSPNPSSSYQLNSLSIIEPCVLPPLDVHMQDDEDIRPPPAKRARARHIFRKCFLASQDCRDATSEVLAPPSDDEA